MRTGRVLASGLFGAALALGITAAPATAADGWQKTVDVSESSYSNGESKRCATSGNGQACFQAYGEWFWLRDSYVNGEPIAMDWYVETSAGVRSGVAYWNGGSAAGWTNLNKSFDEGYTITFRVCEVDIPTEWVYEDTCSSWTSTTT
ncbi:hypothetical protein [Streptomyces sp. NPDC059862]|uniref:hypothetical protein n=1 Tax=unclassified Streptomyces TaxID=2593676 RepID=UPI00363D9697